MMNSLTGMDFTTPVPTSTLSRLQERVELQQLNERFATYVQHVRRLVEKNNQLDSSAIINSTKALEVEINNLKNVYEQELDNLRKELEACNHEKASSQVQVNKHLQYNAELQERLKTETDKTGKLHDEINNYQRKVASLETEIQDMKIAASRPEVDVQQLQRTVDNLTRETETWKHRYELEQVARQEAESKIQQLVQKSELSEKVHYERTGQLNARIESSAATILSLEAKVRDLSKADVSLSEVLKQIRETAEAELRKFRMESEDQYNRNLTALKAQLDNAQQSAERLEAERTQIRGSVGELKAKIRNLEGQMASLEHQKQTLEDTLAVERNRAAEGVHAMERKLREVQDMLVIKMREVTTAREHNIPLKAEIEALKILLEEEEKRLSVPVNMSSSINVDSTTKATSFISSYSLTSAVNTAPVSTPMTFATQPAVFNTQPPQVSTMNSLPPTTAALQTSINFAPEPLPSVPSPVLSTTCVPEVLKTTETTVGAEEFAGAQCTDQQVNSTGGVSKYCEEPTSGLIWNPVEPLPCIQGASVASRAKSAPGERQPNLNLVTNEIGQGHDYFDKMFHDVQWDTYKGRPKTTPMHSNRPLASLYHDYTVSTSSATGDLKIFEVHQDGKYVRLLNDGVQEIEFGGFMLQQNVGGHPVAVFRFPPRTKFAPNSTITVYSGCCDHKLHNPPQDFVWKEQQKWGTGPECTTILCRSNGQAVAWTTAAHRFARDAFQDVPSEADDATRAEEERPLGDVTDDDTLTEISVNVNGPKPDPVYLRREKQQPPSLQANKHPHGNQVGAPIHPHTGQGRPYYYGNDNSSNNRQSRSQTTRPDPVLGQPYAGVAAQKLGSAPLCKYTTGVSVQNVPGIRAGVKTGSPGEASEVPSPFMKPHARFQSGLDQVQSQHHHEFLPPMPRPPSFTC